MAFNPRWYQNDLINGVRYEWSQGHKNVLVVSPPRSGKTAIAVWLSEPFIKAGQGVIFMAHREELVRQLAMTYAEFGYNHNIMAPQDVISDIVRRQIKRFGRSFYDQNSLVMVGSVQTINARSSKLRTFAPRVGLWMTDEAHHLLPTNQWGRAVSLFTNAHGVGFTATPARTDRKSLAQSQGGIFDAMVKGVTARQLITEGYICDYRVIAPPASIDRTKIRVGKTGDFTQKGLTDAKRESTITGDCVESYLSYTPGQQAVVFAVDIAHSNELADAYRVAGVTAEAVSSKTPKHVRKMIMDKFERGVFNVLVNVDLFGEGLNVTGIEVVVMARPTQSFVLYVQQFFRCLTKATGKNIGTIIDHAGNVGFFGRIFGLPDSYNGWVLADELRSRRKKREPDDDLIAVTTCVKCYAPYEAVLPKCPHCGHKPEPTDRSRPEHVEGDLVELDPDTLALMRGEILDMESEVSIPSSIRATPAEARLRKNHIRKKEAQKRLRYNISLWAGFWRDRNACDSEIYRRFYARFETDVMTAQSLNEKDTDQLNEKVDKSLKNLIASNGQ